MSNRATERCLFGMFAKYWQAGSVKTRLAEGVGAEAAAEVYRAFVETLLQRFAEVAHVRQLVYAPPDRRAQMSAAGGPLWELIPQSEGGLGQRMAHFFDQAFATEAERVVLIGSDSPLLPVEFAEQAFAALANHDLVLGPSEDGGYYLIGAALRTPPVFDDVAWSTSSVLEQTLQLAAAAGLRHKLLPTWYDVDHRTDLQRLSEQLTASDQWPTLRTAVHSALNRS